MRYLHDGALFRIEYVRGVGHRGELLQAAGIRFVPAKRRLFTRRMDCTIPLSTREKDLRELAVSYAEL